MTSELNCIKNILTELKPELSSRFHVNSIGLFGSIVKDDFSGESDIDIIVDFDAPIGIEFVDLADLLESKMKKRVDLVSKNGIKDKYYERFAHEIIYV